MSSALRLLSDGLEPYSDFELWELLDLLEQSIENSKSITRQAKQSELSVEDNLRSVPQEDIQKILDQDDYTKKQLVDLGAQRFGISRAKLIRLRKKDAAESIRAALEHERSLDVISEEARRAGEPW